MNEFERAWAVVPRDFRPTDGEDADIVDVVRVFRAEADALAEVARLRQTEGTDDQLFYCEETELATR